MAVNNQLLVITGSVIGGLGTQKALLYTFYPPRCIDAIERTSQLDISQYCPFGFDNFALINVLGLGVGLIIMAFFGQDIVREIWGKLTSSGEPEAR